MNRWICVAAFAAVALLFLIGAAEPPVMSGPLELSLVVAPTTYGPVELLREWHPDTYTCRAIVIDANSHKMLGAPSVVVKPGQEIVRTEQTASGLKVALKGVVNAARTSASVDVTITRGAELVTHQISRVSLARPDRQQR